MIRILLTCMAVAGTGYAFAHPWRDLYGDEIAFDVYREAQRVGEYTTRFSESDGRLLVESDMDLKLQVFLFWHYEYRYAAREVWQDGRLQSLVADVDDNGDRQSVVLSREGEDLIGAGPQGEIRIAPPILPTHHYNAAVIGADRVFNTLTGRVNQIQLRQLGRENLSIAGQAIDATHYRYEGELEETEVWYDDQGRWLKLRFPGSDGTPIEFLCRSCGYRTDS